MRCYLIGLLLVLAIPGADAANSFSSAYISEFLANNQRGLTDEEGRHSGWIEIYNPTREPIDLRGWFLTDTTTNLTRWRFPSVSLLPDKYLVVFASTKNRTNDLLHLHTNFRLARSGGYLALVNPKTNVMSEFAPAYPKQSPDVAYGRIRGEPSLSGPLWQPTPGAPNVISGTGFGPEVSFSRPSGTFTGAFQLQLTAPLSGTVIRYTLDGSMPNSQSPVCEGPFTITNTTYIRARAYREGLFPGPPHTEAYLNLSTNVVGFTSSLPLLVMDTFGKSTPISLRESFVHLSLFEGKPGSLTNKATLATRGSFRVRGSTSSGFRQSPFAFRFIDEFNAEKPLSPFGLPADSEWVLYPPNEYDLAMIHNPFVYQLSRDMGRYSSRTRFVEVFVVRNDGPVKDVHYNGLYVLIEKIKIAPERVNIDHLSSEDLKPPAVTGGYVLKFDRVGPGEGGFYATGDRGMVYVEPSEQTIMAPQRAAQREYLQKFIGDFHRALHGQKWQDPAVGYRKYLDVDAAIDYHVLEVLSGNVDAMVLSCYFHKPRGGKIICGPHWDFDRALGSTDGRDANPRQWNTGPFFGGEWWPRLFSDPDFWQQWVDRWQQLRRNHFSLTNLNNLIDRLVAEVREAQPREYKRWNLDPRGGSYDGEIGVMRGWLSNRLDFIDSQLAQPPRLSQNGGQIAPGFLLSLNAAANASIYYTIDGADPRMGQGGISSNAFLYKAPISLRSNATVMVRAYDTNKTQYGGPPTSTPWSSPVRASFMVK